MGEEGERMERWSLAFRDFLSGKEKYKTIWVFFICYAIARMLFILALAEVVTEKNENLVISLVVAIGMVVGYFVGRFDPGRKELFRNFDHRIVWLVYCLALFPLTWMGIAFGFRLGMY